MKKLSIIAFAIIFSTNTQALHINSKLTTHTFIQIECCGDCCQDDDCDDENCECRCKKKLLKIK